MDDKPKAAAASKSQVIAALLNELNARGLIVATAAQVVAVSKELFPQGTERMDLADVLQAVFAELRRRHAAGQVQQRRPTDA